MGDRLWEKGELGFTVRLSFVQPLRLIAVSIRFQREGSPSYNLSVAFGDTSPSRGGFGIAVQFAPLTAAASYTTNTKRCGTPEAPLLGELAKPSGFD